MTREQKQHILHFAASSLGGFMGGYAIYNHCDVFGNAQTANMIHLVSKIFTHSGQRDAPRKNRAIRSNGPVRYYASSS